MRVRRIDAHDDQRAVLVHGDVHQWNTLHAGDGFQLVDPDGLLAEAGYDMGVVMPDDPWSCWAVTRTSEPGGWRRERASTRPPSLHLYTVS